MKDDTKDKMRHEARNERQTVTYPKFILLLGLAICFWISQSLVAQETEPREPSATLESADSADSGTNIENAASSAASASSAETVRNQGFWYENKAVHGVFTSSWTLHQQYYRFSFQNNSPHSRTDYASKRNRGGGLSVEFGNFKGIMFHIGFSTTYTQRTPFTPIEYEELLKQAGVQYGNYVRQGAIVSLRTDRLYTFLLGFTRYVFFGKDHRSAFVFGFGWAKHTYQLRGEYSLGLAYDGGKEKFKKTVLNSEGLYGRIGYQYLFPNGFTMGFRYEFTRSFAAKHELSQETSIPDSVLNNGNLQFLIGSHF